METFGWILAVALIALLALIVAAACFPRGKQPRVYPFEVIETLDRSPLNSLEVSSMATKFSTTAPVPATMTAVSLDWSGVKVYAEKSVKLLQDHGAEFIDLIDMGFRAFKAVTARDFVGIFAAINAAQRDIQAIIAAIQAEFGI